MSYSLRETDGDAGVYISTVCVSVFVNPCGHDMPTVFHECLQCGVRVSPFCILLYRFRKETWFNCLNKKHNTSSRVLQCEMIPSLFVLSL